MKIGSLFAGIGGFDLAGEWCGHRTIWTSEIDPYCVALLAERFPAAKQLGDISAIDWATVERPDILTGGFPCQDISYAGKGAGLAGKRSGLWYEYARAIREVGPRYVIVENVRALFTRGFDAVLGTLADLGYDAEWSMYGAADVGAPHRRHRAWILAYAQSLGRESGPSDGCLGVSGERPTQQRLLFGDRFTNVVHPASGGRGAGSGQPARRVDGGRAGLGDAEHSGLEGHAGDGDHRHEPGRIDPPAARSAASPGGRVDDATSARRGDGRPEENRPARDQARRARLDRRSGGLRCWADAVPVRGHDGTVRLIPRQAAEEGPESLLWPVADGVPGRVARLRGIGNAIVPACALPIFGRIAELEGQRMMREAA